MSGRKKIIIGAVVVALLIAYIGFAIFNVSRTQANSGVPRNALPVETEKAHRETIVCKVGAKGTVELVEVETVFAQVSAAVDQVYVKADDEVVSGQVLADYDKKALERLNDQLSEATLALQSARLSLQAARLATSDADKLRIENAQNEYDNAKILYEAGAIAKKEVDTAFEALQRAEIQIEEQNKNMQNQISLLQVSVAQSELRISQLNKEIASFSPAEFAMQGGTVIASFVKKGDVVPTGMRLFEIADISLNNLVIKVNVPENEARNLGIGQEVEIRVNAIGQEVFAGHVSKISPLASIKQVGNSMETVLTLEIICEDAPLKAGYTVDATIITKTVADTVVVPLMSTLRENDGHNYIFIMRDDFSVEKRQIELGEYSGIYVQATNVAEDEITILNPSAQLQEEDIFVNPVHFF